MPEPHRITVVDGDASNQVRAHTHPMLEAGNTSFPQGRYDLEFEQDAEKPLSFTIKHCVSGARLIDALIEDGTARYVTVVSCPTSSYRETFPSESPTQRIDCDPDDFGDAPLFTAMVVCVEGTEVRLDSATHDLHPIWNGQSVTLEAGARLALGNVVELEARSFEQLISVDLDENLGDGQFYVEVAAGPPFRFVVHTGKALFHALKTGRGHDRGNVLTHIVTACLTRLKDEYRDDTDEEGNPNPVLVKLREFIEEKGATAWDSDDFKAELAATKLYPLRFPEEADDDE